MLTAPCNFERTVFPLTSTLAVLSRLLYATVVLTIRMREPLAQKTLEHLDAL